MKLEDSAVELILGAMKKKGLDPKRYFFEIGFFEGNLGLGFTREPTGQRYQFGELNVVVQSNVDTTGLVITAGVTGGKTGLVFLGEEDVDHSNG